MYSGSKRAGSPGRTVSSEMALCMVCYWNLKSCAGAKMHMQQKRFASCRRNRYVLTHRAIMYVCDLYVWCIRVRTAQHACRLQPALTKRDRQAASAWMTLQPTKTSLRHWICTQRYCVLAAVAFTLFLSVVKFAHCNRTIHNTPLVSKYTASV